MKCGVRRRNTDYLYNFFILCLDAKYDKNQGKMIAYAEEHTRSLAFSPMLTRLK